MASEAIAAPADGAAADGGAAAPAPDARRVAAATSGLRAGELTTEERKKFRGATREYLEARDAMLEAWHANCGAELSAAAALAALPHGRVRDIGARAHAFLQEHGYINFGAPAPAAPEAPAAAEPPAAAPPAAEPLDPAAAAADAEKAAERALVFRLYELLRAADLGSLSAKGLRRTLEEETGRELSGAMPLLRRHIDHFVQNLETKDTLQPLGYEQARRRRRRPRRRLPAWLRAAPVLAAARLGAASAALLASRRGALTAPPRRRRRPQTHRAAAGAGDGGGAAAPHRAAAV